MTRAAFRQMTLIHPTIAEHLPYLLDDLAPVERA